MFTTLKHLLKQCLVLGGLFFLLGSMSFAQEQAPQDVYKDENRGFVLNGILVGPLQRPQDESLRWVYDLALDRGQTMHDALVLKNIGDKKASALLYPADGGTTVEGGIAFDGQEDTRDEVGRWISGLPELITLEPGEERNITFQISVPADADVGEHWGGIMLQKIIEEEPDVDKNKPGVKSGVNVVARVALKIFITVPGDIKKVLSISQFIPSVNNIPFEPGYQPTWWDNLIVKLGLRDEGNVSIALHNQGNASVTTEKVVLKITNKILNLPYTTKELGPWQIFYTKDFQTNVKWADRTPFFGLFKAQLLIDYHDGNKVVQNAVTESTIWIIPWFALYLLMLLIFILLIIFYTFKYFLRTKLKRLQETMSIYLVQPGDKLPRLAEIFGVSLEHVITINQLTPPYELTIGQQLLLPLPKTIMENRLQQYYMQSRSVSALPVANPIR